MAPPRTHYEILGVDRNATPEQIKARYRHLAKRYHPDVSSAKGADAHRAFAQITEAYHVLIDPTKRALYDYELRLQAEQEARARAAAVAPQQQSPPKPSADIGQQFFNAQMDYARGRFTQALEACRQVLRLDPRHAGAHSLMGDIFRAQGRTDEAIRMYTMAIQLNPDSRSDLEKLERLVRRNQRSDSRGGQGQLSTSQRLGAVLGCLLFTAFTFLPVVFPGEVVFPGFVLLNSWTDTFLMSMAGASVAAGFVASTLRIVGPLEDDFLFHSLRTPEGPVPVGLWVTVVSIIFFPLAFLFYVCIALMQGSGSPALLRAILVSAAVVLLFALIPLAQGNAVQTLLFGGNVVFPCLVIGCFAAGLLQEPY